MNQPVLGIIGGGQLGSMLSEAAKKVDIKTVVLSDDPDAPPKILQISLYMESIMIQKL